MPNSPILKQQIQKGGGEDHFVLSTVRLHDGDSNLSQLASGRSHATDVERKV